MKFKKEFLQEIDWDSSLGAEIVEDKIVDHDRWSIYFDRIFKFQGKLYRTSFGMGATEIQDHGPYEFPGD